MNKGLIVRTFLAAAAALAFLACTSTSNTQLTTTANPITGQHPANWQTTHYAAYLAAPASCVPCHGSTTDAGGAAGTSQVSCFGCHHPAGPNHPAGWADPEQHGRMGAQLAANSADFSMQGFASCQICHGQDFNTPVGVTPSCLSCHTHAPHPDAPWGATNPPPAITSPRHDKTDQSNAPVCYTCHAAGSSHNPYNPVTPAPAGTTPGCFNNTMCHGTNPPIIN